MTSRTKRLAPHDGNPRVKRTRLTHGQSGSVGPSMEINALSSVPGDDEQIHQQGVGASCVSVDNHAELSYDVCFGVLLMEVTSTHCPLDPPPHSVPVDLHLGAYALILRYQGSNRSIGLVVSEGLTRLIKTNLATLTAILAVADPQRPKNSLRTRESSFPLRVTVYGRLSDGDAVANILAEGGLFLQRPEESEYDRRVKYHNPMYLLPPGQDTCMPRVAVPLTGGARFEPIEEERLGEVETSRILRIFDHADGHGAEVIEQSARLRSTLKDHQREALTMMVEREGGALGGKLRFPSLWEASEEGDRTIYRHVVTKALQDTPLPSLRGGILADEMGLGKTLSALALICHHVDRMSDTSSPGTIQATKGTLIVTPMSTIYGWQQQIERHIRPGCLRWIVYHGPKRREALAGSQNPNVVLTTYDTLRSDWATNGLLYGRTWERVILDEAHKIRNRSSKIFSAACEIPARNRWCLTGTPIQNSLSDYGALLAFIGVPPFTVYEQFRFWILSPVLNNQRHNLRTLRKLVRATCLRRTKARLGRSSSLDLPPKKKRVVAVELSSEERELYDFFKRRSYLVAESGRSHGSAEAGNTANQALTQDTATGKVQCNNANKIVILISVLRRICDHGEALLPRDMLDIWRKRENGTLTWASLQTAARSGPVCCVCSLEFDGGDVVDVDGEQRATEAVRLACGKHVACGTCVTSTEDRMPACPECRNGASAESSAESSPPNGTILTHRQSSKVRAMMQNILSTLKSCDPAGGHTVPAKSVIFSHWTGMLDLIFSALNPELASLGFSLARIDGQSSLSQRRSTLDRFNSDAGCVVMLATIGAVGEGVDLSAASQVHITEPHWNPMAEAQAVDRVHRIGQTKEVTIIRYYVKQSIEEYIIWVQRKKARMIKQSLSSGDVAIDGREKAEEDLIEKRWQKLLRFLS